MATRPQVLLCLAVALGFGLPAGAATPVLYHSPADDGVNPGVPAMVGEGAGVVLHLYVDGGAVASGPGEECYIGPNDELCGWDFGLVGQGSITFTGFAPAGDVEYNLGSTALRLNGGNPFVGTLGPSKVGDLEIAALDGDSVVLQRGDVVTSALTLTQVPPGPVVMVPEPNQLILLLSGVALLSLCLRPAANAPLDRSRAGVWRR